MVPQHYCQVGVEIQVLHLAFSDTTMLKVGASHHSPQRVQALHSVFVGEGRGGATVFLRLAGVKWSSSKSFLCFQVTPLWILQLEKAGFSWIFFCLHLLVFVDCQLLQYPVWMYEAKQNKTQTNQGTYHCAVSQVPMPLADLLSLCLSKSCVCLYVIPKLYLVDGTEKSMFSPSSLKQKSLTYIFEKISLDTMLKLDYREAMEETARWVRRLL